MFLVAAKTYDDASLTKMESLSIVENYYNLFIIIGLKPWPNRGVRTINPTESRHEQPFGTKL